MCFFFFFFSSRRRHTRCGRDWSSDVCSSDLLGTGDITSALTVPGHLKGSARFITKETGVICGWPVVEKVFQILDPEIRLTVQSPEGAIVKEGEVVAEISGPRSEERRVGKECEAAWWRGHVTGRREDTE